MKKILLAALLAVSTSLPAAIPPEWNAKGLPDDQRGMPADQMKLNEQPEPATTGPGFTGLFNGKDLAGWKVAGGNSTYHVEDAQIIGTVNPAAPRNTFLTTEKEYANFLLTIEFKWDTPFNSGVQIRSFVKPDGFVAGPQLDLDPTERRWTAGFYGEQIGGWMYPLKLPAHEAARHALKLQDWNRLTVEARGPVVRTWLNGVPVAFVDNATTLTDRTTGFIGLQVHKGKSGQIRWRNIRIKEFQAP